MFLKVTVCELAHCECLRIEKSNFASLRRFCFYITSHRMERRREKSLRAKSFHKKRKKKETEKSEKDNGKSNFCITKHFALFVLQGTSWELRGRKLSKRGNDFIAQGPEPNNS